MIEKISLGLMNESGEVIEIDDDALSVEIKLDSAICHRFTEIVLSQNRTADAEIKLAEKFHFLLNLKNYETEIK